MPAELVDIALCLETGWTWSELMATPNWVVENLKLFLSKRALIRQERRALLEAHYA